MNLRLPEVFPSFQALGRYGSHEYCAHPGNCIPLWKGDPDGSSDMSQIHRRSFTTEAPDFHTHLLKEHPNTTVTSAIYLGNWSSVGSSWGWMVQKKVWNESWNSTHISWWQLHSLLWKVEGKAGNVAWISFENFGVASWWSNPESPTSKVAELLPAGTSMP